ncbi:unnamed protein product [Mytilus coruscus]|uniref:Uncharacterized protein n=1 Tax=Mytilus coruscus TaxID=42192 RepID=A0A6J8AB25_MYTCO|nr:unnamed protein product [Mytilus coruscus]
MNTMDKFYLFINSEDSLSAFENNVGGNFKVRLQKRYTVDGSWKCALLDLSFIPELEASTRRIYLCSDFVQQSYIEPRNHPDCAQRFCISVKKIPRHKTEKMEDDPLSDTFEDDMSVSSDIADRTKNAPISSEDAEIREDLIACRDSGVVFAHIRGLEAHSQQGFGRKTSLLSR